IKDQLSNFKLDEFMDEPLVFEVTARGRYTFSDKAKKLAGGYKKKVRDMKSTGANDAETHAKQDLGKIMDSMEDMTKHVKALYGKINPEIDAEDADKVAEAEGEELWKKKWLNTIRMVNKAIDEEWPAFKTALINWIRTANSSKGLDLSVEMGELTYIGSLATGYKGPPKQQVRFNAAKFDVDANLDAPGIADYGVNQMGLEVDRQMISHNELKKDVTPFRTFPDKIDSKIAANYDEPENVLTEPFELMVKADDPIQESRKQAGSAVINDIRTIVDNDTFNALVSRDDMLAPYLEESKWGWSLKEIYLNAEWFAFTKRILNVKNTFGEEFPDLMKIDMYMVDRWRRNKDKDE
ncbi:MAG: hypothetical protein AAF570_26345, partial [Bacteroidota bacterium]